MLIETLAAAQYKNMCKEMSLKVHSPFWCSCMCEYEKDTYLSHGKRKHIQISNSYNTNDDFIKKCYTNGV